MSNLKFGFIDSNQMATVRAKMLLVPETIETTRDAYATIHSRMRNLKMSSKLLQKFLKRNISTYWQTHNAKLIRYANVDGFDSTVVSTSARQDGQITRIGRDPIGSGTSVNAC